jgi:Protein of unknown function (DUF2281)
MSNIELIINELNSVPESMLVEVLNFIRSAKKKAIAESDRSRFQRIAGLHEGQIWMSDDFNDSLPDEFWLGEDR